MKTIRTIIATLAGVLLTFALVAWFSVRRNAAFIQRTIYQGFDQTFVVALVMGCAFLLIAVILTVAIVSTDEDEEEEEEEETFRPRTRPRAQAPMERRMEDRPTLLRGEEPYRRVSRTRTMDQERSPRREADSTFARPRGEAEEKPVPRKRERLAERPDEIDLAREEAPVKREKKAPRSEGKPAYEPEAKPKRREPERETRPKRREADLELKPKRRMVETEVAEEAEDQEEAFEPELVREAPAPEPDPVKEPAEEAGEAAAEALEEAVPEAKAAEPTVRCIFCGSVISKGHQFCPNCGKKR